MKYIIIFVVFLAGCKDKNEINLNELQKKSIKKVINSFLKENRTINKDYLISPYFGDFEFNSFFETKDKRKIDKHLRKVNWNKETFLKVQKRVNSKYKNKSSKDLFKLSKGESSEYIFKFSGFSDKMFFFEIYHTSEKINREQLHQKIDFFDLKKIEVFSFIAILNKGKVENIIVGDIINYEL